MHIHDGAGDMEGTWGSHEHVKRQKWKKPGEGLWKDQVRVCVLCIFGEFGIWTCRPLATYAVHLSRFPQTDSQMNANLFVLKDDRYAPY